ncbi:hypothetical protein [Phytohabitans suffuscus]|uniref:hypothetical protein n=1 Tax=Phytohabitans suffuscus TaxID=624315 RepID=UPI001E4C309F|nr:hypothetical protein [Phytohabitans suffuscus]
METVRCVIDIDLPGAQISRHLYGHLTEHLGRCIYGGLYVGEDSDIPNEGGIRLDVVEALRAIAVPNLRWPGGCFAEEYHWRDGIGPRERRPRIVNSYWGDVVEDNSFGTHEFMALCDMVGAEPYIAVNVGSGSAREAGEWAEYLTRGDDSPMAALRRANGRDGPWRVRLWGLGNEPWGCGGGMRPEAYADLARVFGTYSRDHGDNQLYRVAAGSTADSYEWTEALMKALELRLGGARPERLWPTFQAISFHHYTVPGPWENKGAPRTSASTSTTGRWRRRPASRSSSPATPGSWTPTTRRRPSVWCWASGAPGSTPSRAPTRPFCFSRAPCATRSWPAPTSTSSTATPTAS